MHIWSERTLVPEQSLNTEAYFEREKWDELTIFLHTKSHFSVILALIRKWGSFCSSWYSIALKSNKQESKMLVHPLQIIAWRHQGVKLSCREVALFPLLCQVHRVLVCTHRLSWLAKCVLCEHEATLGRVTHQSQERQSSPSADIPLIPGPAVCVRPTFLLVNWANCFFLNFYKM